MTSDSYLNPKIQNRDGGVFLYIEFKNVIIEPTNLMVLYSKFLYLARQKIKF